MKNDLRHPRFIIPTYTSIPLSDLPIEKEITIPFYSSMHTVSTAAAL